MWDRPNHGILSYGRPSIYKPVPNHPIAVKGGTRKHVSHRYLPDQQAQILEDILQNLNGGNIESANNQPLGYLCPFIHLGLQCISSDMSWLRETFRNRSHDHARLMADMAASHTKIINYAESLRNLIHTLKIRCQADAGEPSATILEAIGFCERVLDDYLRLCSLVQERL